MAAPKTTQNSVKPGEDKALPPAEDKALVAVEDKSLEFLAVEDKTAVPAEPEPAQAPMEFHPLVEPTGVPVVFLHHHGQYAPGQKALLPGEEVVALFANGRARLDQ